MHLTPQQRASMNGVAVVREYCRRTGRTYAGQVIWTDEEIALLTAAWPCREAALKALPGRSLSAIEHRAAKLGLPVRSLHLWSNPESARFRRLWPTATKRELLETFPFATWTSLHNFSQWQRANGFPDLKRPKARPSKTGHELVDAVLDQAERCNMSLKELDEGARTRRYFSSGRHRRQVKNWKHLGKAVAYFEGELSARFPASDG